MTTYSIPHLTLLSLPWSSHVRPSAALGALAAYVRDQLPHWDIAIQSQYVHLASRIGFELYRTIAEHAYSVGELLYLGLLHPEQQAILIEPLTEWACAHLSADGPAHWIPGLTDWSDAMRSLLDQLSTHLDDVVEGLSPHTRVLGLSTCFGQLFANLVLAQRVKQRYPHIVIILGGSTISGPVGPSLLSEYPMIDYIIQGEGEQPLVALLTHLEAPEQVAFPPRGVVSRGDGVKAPQSVPLWEVTDMNALPSPDYDEYSTLAQTYGIDWRIPMEGSRGCWWDRTKRSGNPKSTCFFCNLNVQWNGYREKSVDRVVRELQELSERYENTGVYFLDNIIRHKGLEALADGITSLKKDFQIFYEMRANVRPIQLLKMWNAGLTSVQFGIEGLSSRFLQRIGKGTTVIQNLEAMKTCRELGIQNAANLILNFPGSTPEEVEETRQAILQYAIPYEPCSTSRFGLGVGSTVETLPGEFGIENIRNSDYLQLAMPEVIWKRLKLFDLMYDTVAPDTDWAPVEQACKIWRERHRPAEGALLWYADGGTFLRITDKRNGYEVLTLNGIMRELYLYCSEIRRYEHLMNRFCPHELTDEELNEGLEELVASQLMYRESDRYLSLALAASPQAAAKRIREVSAMT